MKKDFLLISTYDIKAVEGLGRCKTDDGYVIKGRVYYEVGMPSCYAEWFVLLATSDTLALGFDELWGRLLKTRSGEAVLGAVSIIADRYSRELLERLSSRTARLPSRVRKSLMETARCGFVYFHSDEYLDRVDEREFADRGIWEAIYVIARAL
ncbi:MAG: hypothetical protein IJM18_09805 [Clostridia bacterium]|nr:hypothetical protein [Clostridia bacterium]